MEPSRYVLGTCKLPDDDKESLSFIRSCYDMGITTIDTGWNYCGPHVAEKKIGQFLSTVEREKVHIIDKFPLFDMILKDVSLDKCLDEQLKALGTDYIDTYMLHAVFDDPTVDESTITRVIELLQDYKKEGRIKNIGFSAHLDKFKLKYVMGMFDWDCCMLSYNILTSDVAKAYPEISVLTNAGYDGVRFAQDYGMRVYAMMPLENGRVFQITHDPVFKKYAMDFVRGCDLINNIVLGSNNLDHIKEYIGYADRSE